MFGTWRAGGFPPWITLVAKLALMGDMMVRGADYAFGDSADTARRLSEIESAAPLQWWGMACLLAAVLGCVGIVLRRATPILWAHIMGAAIYAALGAGVALDVVYRVHDPARGLATALPIAVVAVALLVASRLHPHAQDLLLSLSAVACAAAVGVATVGLDGLRSATILSTVAVLHLLMAIGTAARARQATIREARQCE